MDTREAKNKKTVTIKIELICIGEMDGKDGEGFQKKQDAY